MALWCCAMATDGDEASGLSAVIDRLGAAQHTPDHADDIAALLAWSRQTLLWLRTTSAMGAQLAAGKITVAGDSAAP